MSFWGKLGKIGLKIAPYAAMAIPGVGPLASMGIQAGIGAAQKKASGGSWLDALKSGGISGAASYVGGKVPELDKITKGIGPSGGGNFVKDAVSGTANKALGQGGFKGALGGVLKKTGQNILSDFGNRAGGIFERDPMGEGNLGNRVGLPEYAMNFGGGDRERYTGGLGPRALPDMRNPNLQVALMQGRNEAIRNQPWRAKEYDRSQPQDIFPTTFRKRQNSGMME